MFETPFGERDTGEKMSIAVIGIGHVGLPTALGLAELGWDVIGADSTANVVERLQVGHTTFLRTWHAGPSPQAPGKWPIKPTADVEGSLSASKVLFVCLGRP